METIIFTIFACILLLSRDKNLLLENLALKQQLAIMKQKNKRPKIRLRDCINAMIILNEAHLRHILTEYLVYYHEDRTHLGLGKETPAGRSVQEKPDNAKVVAFPRLGGLHHRYEWQEAA
jgi:hypothetical protein